MASAMKIAFRLGVFVTIGMIIGATLQLEFIRRLEDSDGDQSARLQHSRSGGNTLISRSKLFVQPSYVLTDLSNSNIHDKEAITLRLGYVNPEILSWSPRVILFHNFLSIQECDYLRSIAMPRLKNSTIVNKRTGKEIPSYARTSSSMFLSANESSHPIIEAIEKRISVFSQVPVENGELIQVIRYGKGQYYKRHYDYFSHELNVVYGGQRVATMLIYLSHNVEGGETHFPEAGSGDCTCGGKIVKGLSVKPVKGDAVLFWSMGLDGKSDPNSLHAGCEVLAGVKWSATKLMGQRSQSEAIQK